jgi:large subunit ribosomal protein L13
MKRNKTYSAKPKEIKREWYLFDAKDFNLGRLATRVAEILRGKHKPIFTPNIDTGDYVVIVNSEKVKLSGKKIEQKTYFSHSGYAHGMKLLSIRQVMARDPRRIVLFAVKGMLPKGRLGRQMIKKMKIYTGDEHPHKDIKFKNLSGKG